MSLTRPLLSKKFHNDSSIFGNKYRHSSTLLPADSMRMALLEMMRAMMPVNLLVSP
jgi:hypothetical protein